MYLARRPNNIPFDLVRNGSVATIGAYDGIHLGHRKILDTVLEKARADGLASVVMSFEPTPKEHFSSSSPPARLMRFREKFEALAGYEIDLFYCPRFDEQMKNIAADTFIRQILIQSLNIRHLVIGDDFRFAKGREGDIEQLSRAGKALEYEVHQAASVIEGGERVSSTAIRRALWAGDLDHDGQLDLLDKSVEQEVMENREVECLGMTFPNDEARREYFLEKLLCKKRVLNLL